MANNRTITAANAVLMLGVTGLYSTPRRIQGFSADDITSIDGIVQNETSMGVDGRLSGGFVFNTVNQSLTLQADSESVDFFENWQQAERQQRESFVAFGSILLRATNKRYVMTRGFLTNASLLPAIRKTLQPRQYTITWEKVQPGPV